jgi:hypothetical protein
VSTPLRTLVTTNSVPASYQPPTDMQGLIEAVPNFTTYVLNDNGAVMQVNANGAGASLDGLWVWMLNQYKLPARLMTGYRNNWWQVYTGKPYELRWFIGYTVGYFDSSGFGIEAAGWEGWAICNGQNGTFNFAKANGLFIVPGYRWDGTWWVTNVTDTVTDTYFNAAGQDFVLGVWNFPILPLWVVSTNFYKWTASNTGGFWSVRDPGPPSSGGESQGNQALWTYPIDQNGTFYNFPISRIPPYIAAGIVQFVGYR